MKSARWALFTTWAWSANLIQLSCDGKSSIGSVALHIFLITVSIIAPHLLAATSCLPVSFCKVSVLMFESLNKVCIFTFLVYWFIEFSFKFHNFVVSSLQLSSYLALSFLKKNLILDFKVTSLASASLIRFSNFWTSLTFVCTSLSYLACRPWLE